MMRSQHPRMVHLLALMSLLIVQPEAKAGQDQPFWSSRVPYAASAVHGRERQVFLLNQGWQYLEQNLPYDNALLSGTQGWEGIDLPHSWNRFDATDNIPGYRRDGSWYRRALMIPELDNSRIWRLYFEGANISCAVYVNGQKAGSHVGGYVGFAIDITPFIDNGKMNQILVRVDNAIDPNIIPSQKSDFVIYGGISRDVWLEALPPVYVDQAFVSTPEVSAELADTEVELEINNTTAASRKLSLELTLKDPHGVIVSRETLSKNVKPGGNKLTLALASLKKPKLWSTSQPDLYTLSVSINDGRNLDRITRRFGYRWFDFVENGPFYLNGERLLLRGTHRHEEFAGYGNAMPDSLHRRDMAMIKEMGANFVRLGHYPQDPEVYRACDELGLLVWDELPWCRGGMGGAQWRANTKRLLSEQIRQNFNHPSIILWSVGNELYWLPDFPNGDNIDSLTAFVSELNDLTHKLDPGRMTAMRKFYEGAAITDVFSPSIWAGWYSGVYKNYELALKDARQKYPRFFHAEYGGSSHVGRHTENPITGEGLVRENEWAESPNMIDVKKVSSAGDWSENYVVDLFDWHLKISEQLDWFTGSAQWAFKDFATPLRPENPIPYINQKGLVDRAGKPKDAYYVFKSYWATNPKFCYIESPTWKERRGLPGEKRGMSVYSNCDQVELILNGHKQGMRKRDLNDFPASGFQWDLLFAEGNNEVVAVGYSQEQEVARDSLTINYAQEKHGTPARIDLTQRPMTNGNILVEAVVVDKRGNLCVDFEERVYFDHNGSGKLLVDYGTPTRSGIIEFANGRAAIEFVPAGYGKAIIEARTQDFKGSYLVIE